MNDRIARFRASLLNQLEAASVHGRFGTPDRLRWLAGQLDTYVERWIGFGVAASLAPAATAADDLSNMIDAAKEVVDSEVRAAGVSVNEWRAVVEALAHLRQGDWDEAPALRETIKQLARSIGQLGSPHHASPRER